MAQCEEVEYFTFTCETHNRPSADMTIMAGNKAIHCHKIVMMNNTEYFKDVPLDNTTQERSVFAFQERHDLLIAIVTFCYSGEISVAEEDVIPLLTLVEELGVKGLTATAGRRTYQPSQYYVMPPPETINTRNYIHASPDISDCPPSTSRASPHLIDKEEPDNEVSDDGEMQIESPMDKRGQMYVNSNAFSNTNRASAARYFEQRNMVKFSPASSQQYDHTNIASTSREHSPIVPKKEKVEPTECASKIKPTRWKNYTDESLECAVNEIIEGKIKPIAAVLKYNIPRRSLFRGLERRRKGQ